MTQPHTTRTVSLKYWRFPNYWEELVEPIESSVGAVARLIDLQRSCDTRDAEGVTYFLEDERGNELEVHCSGDHWAIAFFPIYGKPVITSGNPSAKGSKPFLIPEWTEVERKHLISPEMAQDVVKEWIDTGKLSNSVVWKE